MFEICEALEISKVMFNIVIKSIYFFYPESENS